MEEKELLRKIKELGQIRPRKNWVILKKREILGKESSIYFLKPVFLGLTFLVILSILIISKNSLPGDFLYPLKKMTEKSQAVFLSEKEKPKYQLQLANKRLEELTKIAKTNQTKKLSPAIREVKKSLKEAAKSLERPQKLEKEIVFETKKLKENREKIKALGILIENNQELDNSLAQLAEREIKNLEKRTLTEKQKEILEKVKEDFEKKNFAEALEKLLKIK
jgi:hypothetical protein